MEQADPELPAATTIMDASSALSFNSGLQVFAEQPSEAGQPQELIVMSGALVGSPSLGVQLMG